MVSESRSPVESTGWWTRDLARWGPAAQQSHPPSLEAARAYCRELATGHYENFPVISIMLPRSLRQHFCNVYAYCRWSDNLSDEVADRQESLQLLAWWRGQLEACFAGQCCHPVFVALSETVREFDIPQQPFADLLTAFEQDQRVCEYQTFSQLREYCRGSADPVGRIVLYVCRCFNARTAELSDKVCTGLQLANFWQDVARDWQMGRIYLPEEDRVRFGYSREDFERRLVNDAFRSLMRFEVDRARQLLREGSELVEWLPWRLQIPIDLFARGGLRILERIEAIDYRVWEKRPEVSRSDVAGLLLRSLVAWLPRQMRRAKTGKARCA